MDELLVLLRVAELLRVCVEGDEDLTDELPVLLRVAELDLVAELFEEEDELEDERTDEEDEELRVVPDVVLLEDPREVRVCASMRAGVRK
ncbi:MAG: hypothetical protein IJ799_08695, partial [Bacteroidales bacterium]|nr:hypothetical protein [Bacteroidales bacterium]